jgi:7-cyano-7-deazaguanine synthase
MPNAVVLVSGGLDSATCLGVATQAGFDCYALSFDYGQRHRVELQAAAQLAEFFKVKTHKVVQLPHFQFQGSALTDPTIAVPDYTGEKAIPVTYVPARNTIFLSMALALAESVEAQDIFIGVSSVDYSGYPDCRPEYIEAFQKMAQLATKAGVEGKGVTIHAPLIDLSKAETIRLGLAVGVDYSLTVSCYQADAAGAACGRCDSCEYRKKGFQELGVADPTRYIV